MLRTLSGLALVTAALALSFGMMKPASASGDRQHVSGRPVQELAAQTRRPRVTIYPRRSYPGPNAKRQCRSWLVKEYRVSGPVIVPQMRCWWE